MRKLLFILMFMPAVISAQTVKYGFFSLNEVLEALPEYGAAQNDYNSLLEICDKEIAHNEAELTRAYVAFLDGQPTFPEPILRKRQKELQEMVDRGVVLRDQLKDYLSEAHDSLFAPIEQKVDVAIEKVCLRHDLAYAIDTDKGAYRYINPNFCVKITDLIIQEVISPKPLDIAPAAVEEVEEAEGGDSPATEDGGDEVMPTTTEEK